MATAGTHATPTKHPRAREERERAHKSATEHLQASAEIDKARQKATADVRRSLDSALERMRDVNGGLRQRAEAEPLSDTTRSSMRVIGLSARWATTAVRAQRTPEALKELSDEIRKQKTEPGAAGAEGRRCQGLTDDRRRVAPESVRSVGRVEARWPRSTSWS